MKHIPRKKQVWKFHSRFGLDENEELLESTYSAVSLQIPCHVSPILNLHGSMGMQAWSDAAPGKSIFIGTSFVFLLENTQKANFGTSFALTQCVQTSALLTYGLQRKVALRSIVSICKREAKVQGGPGSHHGITITYNSPVDPSKEERVSAHPI